MATFTKKLIQRFHSQSGSALVGAVVISVILTFMAVGYLQVSTSVSNDESQTLKDAKAFYAAEAGMDMGYTWLKTSTNFNQTTALSTGGIINNIIPNLQVNGVTVQVDLVKGASNVTVRSTAQTSSMLHYNKVVSQAVTSGPPFPTGAFDYAIVCGGTFDFGGSGGITSNLKLHSNGALTITGDASANLDVSSSTSISMGNKTLNGSVTAPVLTINAGGTVTGTKTTTAVAVVTIPDIDLTPYYNIALANSQVYTGTFTNANFTPPGGVVWVNGDVRFSGGPGTHFNGTIIATGSISSIAGQVDVNGPAGGLAIAAITGDIKITTSGAIDGLVYAKNGSYEQTANGNLKGQLIAKGNVKKGGTSDAVIYAKADPTIVAGGSSATCSYVVGTWAETNVQ
jgi:Tfp pilus assembly protein PilX